MSDDETDEGYNEFIKEYGSRYEWDNEGNPEFIPDLPSVRNSTSLFHVLLQSDVIYLPQILSLIELPYYSYELREEIWPDGIDKNEIKVDDNADEIKRCNDVIKLCKNHLRELFHKGLSSEKMLIQAEKENAPDFITAFSDCLRQVSNVQISTQSGFSNNNFISAFLNLELTRPSMAGWYTTNLTSPERYVC
ncbi:hypothetical protein GLOIN_2v1882275 [Rhizophagus irregularis DAOM 181602=DAOM 197198]|nr:hypothetical protein GLOIN_2v1882275 [Rhizophagus irregularis DAOM 181602=DAOM 197198]